MSLTTGIRLGPYEIQSALGAGGMGEVYRARDTRLDRDVAVKVLPAAASADPERLRRFEQEARAAAALNHPNIVAVHDIGLHEGAPFIVMELLDGETLRERLAAFGAHGPKSPSLERPALPVRKAIEYGVQIARGLAAAHDKGIVHRDLKPENLFVTADGRVKILDFGLAKLRAPEPALAAATELPTMAAPTTPGMVLGTVGYMAPEQVRGGTADHRADLFALGTILYEMLAGRRAFHAPTTAETMTAILREDPPELALDGVPPGLARLVQRCMEKSPAARFKSADDLAFALEALSSAPVSATSTPARAGARSLLRNAGVAWVVAVVAITLAAVSAAMLRVGGSEERFGDSSNATTRVEINLPAGVELWSHHGAVAVSADGRRLAFIGVRGGMRQVYVRRLDQFEATALRGTDFAVNCFFAPDGAAIGFINSSGVVGKVSLTDGLFTTLTDNADYTIRGTWGANDRITFTRGGALWQVPASGGAPVQLTTLDTARQEVLHGVPVAAGDRGFMVFGSSVIGSRSRIEALVPPGGTRRVLIEAGAYPVAATSGHLVFFRDGALFAVPLDVGRVEVVGAPVRVVADVAVDSLGMPLSVVSDSGTLVYQSSETAGVELVWISRDGGTQPVTDRQRPYGNPRLSSDGRRLLVEASGDLWIFDTERSTFTRLTSDQMAANTFPVWTPDGTRVVFKTRTNLRWVAADGSGRAEDIPGTLASDFPSSISPDGNVLAFARATSGTVLDVYTLSLRGDSNPRPVVNTTATEGGPQFSPDGTWLAYVSNDTGQLQVYLRPLVGPERRWQVSTDGGTSPLWRRDGRELFYRNGNQMMAVEVSPGAEPGLSRPRTLFEQQYAYGSTITLPNYDVRPDGQGFVMVRDAARAGRLNVVMNWFSELSRRDPAAGR
ncbi:MAG: protein kinase domain-containing protein [Vicinamibacterales bacterium]